MDPVTHGLASFALKRGFFPKVPRPILISMILAGTLADLDWFSGLFGPSAYISWNGGALHSISGALMIAFAVSFAIRGYAKSRSVILSGTLWWLAPVCAALLHAGMDALLSSGIKLFWPFIQKRIALDWAPGFDLWLLLLLLAGIFLPELSRLVSDEIGARSKKPRGQVGVIVSFVLIIVYFGLRGMMHTSAVSMILERSYSGESARRAAAFPDSTSPFTWHGIVETESAIHLLQVPTGSLAKFDPENALHIHKPEPSPMLGAAQKTDAARQFLIFARFPKATVQRETEGYSVELRDMKYDALGQTSRIVEAEISLNATGQVTFAQLEWQGQAHKH
ncbi:MAG TPA: metal-dependent hydrolase [Candidatus Dormibacteraeota bacterium]|nr:metal-dependent hydrolase [Candidatus Dormibacteraeota bacterium]